MLSLHVGNGQLPNHFFSSLDLSLLFFPSPRDSEHVAGLPSYLAVSFYILIQLPFCHLKSALTEGKLLSTPPLLSLDLVGHHLKGFHLKKIDNERIIRAIRI